MYKNILLATDGSEYSIRAAERVIEIQKAWKSKIVVFHSVKHHMIPIEIPITVPMAVGSTYRVPQADYSRIQADYEKGGEKVLKNTKNLFDKANIPIETRLIKEEEPSDYIEKVIKKEGFDLVVLGSKGHHSKLKEVFVGTVAEKVLNKVACDVLIIR